MTSPPEPNICKYTRRAPCRRCFPSLFTHTGIAAASFTTFCPTTSTNSTANALNMLPGWLQHLDLHGTNEQQNRMSASQ